MHYLPSVYLCRQPRKTRCSMESTCQTPYVFNSDILNAYTRNPSALLRNWTVIIVKCTRWLTRSSITELISQPLDCHDHWQRGVWTSACYITVWSVAWVVLPSIDLHGTQAVSCARLYGATGCSYGSSVRAHRGAKIMPEKIIAVLCYPVSQKQDIIRSHNFNKYWPIFKTHSLSDLASIVKWIDY